MCFVKFQATNKLSLGSIFISCQNILQIRNLPMKKAVALIICILQRIPMTTGICQNKW